MREHPGFAVIDTETTGIIAGMQHRIAEIAIIHTDARGVVTDEWSTLLNPERDLGPQGIHGIHAADVRNAPTFDAIAGDIIERLHGRVVVAHNWPFDARHLRSEFARLELDTVLDDDAGLCTMRAVDAAMLGSGRSLIDCCAAAGLPERDWHTARDDALAAAELLGFLLEHHPAAVTPTTQQLQAAHGTWPNLMCGVVAPVERTPVEQVEPHFLARISEQIPRDEEPVVDAYFAMLDDALLDRRISASEADALSEPAAELGLSKTDAINTHHTYVRELAKAAWADGIVTAEERKDIYTVATLLGLNADTAERILDETETVVDTETTQRNITPGGLTLGPGEKVVLTGTMRRSREYITDEATAVGVRVLDNVTKKTDVVVAADPDSLSGKAEKARRYDIPVVTEEAFLRALSAMAQNR